MKTFPLKKIFNFIQNLQLESTFKIVNLNQHYDKQELTNTYANVSNPRKAFLLQESNKFVVSTKYQYRKVFPQVDCNSKNLIGVI